VASQEEQGKEIGTMWKQTAEDFWTTALRLAVVVLLRIGEARLKLRRAEAGQSMVEYAIVVALVALIAMAGVQAFGNGVQQVFQQLLSKIQSIGA
jgi:Flp pilus assembly pilin Flp